MSDSLRQAFEDHARNLARHQDHKLRARVRQLHDCQIRQYTEPSPENMQAVVLAAESLMTLTKQIYMAVRGS